MLTLRTRPFQYQIDCHREIEDLNGIALVALPPGAGKSLTSLLFLHSHQKEIDVTVVVCPASVKWVWEGEARKHLGLRTEILEGKTARTDLIHPKTRMFIVNYDILGSWLPFLSSLKPKLIIGDECHYVSSYTARRSVYFRELCRGVPYILALSGTPLVNRPKELWNILNILRPKRWRNRFSFCHRYCGARFIFGRWDFRGASHLPELHRKLHQSVLVRRKEEEIFAQLPPRSRFVVPLDISNKKEYDKAVSDFAGWLRETNPGRASRAIKAERMVKLGYCLRLAAQGKLAAVTEWIDNFLDGGKKLLVFGIHDKVLTHLEERYQRICVRVDGSVTGKTRQKCFDQFNKVAKTRLLLGNIDAAGVGWSCSSTSDVAIIELPYSPGKLTQAEKRIHGVGRGLAGQRARSWLLIAHGTLEERLCEMLQRKQKNISRVLDGQKTRNDLEIFDQLLLELEGSVRGG